MKFNTEQEYYDSQIAIKEPKKEEFGCCFCWNKKRKKEIELFFLDNANNIRVCTYCPSCGRKFGGENGHLE